MVDLLKGLAAIVGGSSLVACTLFDGFWTYLEHVFTR
jgi:hypothetical protein